MVCVQNHTRPVHIAMSYSCTNHFNIMHTIKTREMRIYFSLKFNIILVYTLTDMSAVKNYLQ